MMLLPDDACDAHVHLTGAQYPASKNRAEDPPDIMLATQIDRYRAHLSQYGLTRGVIVQSVLYGTDNRVTLDALRALGPRFRAVVLAGDEVDDNTLDALADAGAQALRMNYVHGGVLTWPGAMALAPRLAARGMHLEILAHAHQVAELAGDVRRCPVPVVFDHCAWPKHPDDLTALCALLNEGHAWTKLSAPHRWAEGFDPHLVIAKLHKANPERCLWGSDWPHLMLAGAVPDVGASLAMIYEIVTQQADQLRLFAQNPATLYRF